MAGNALRLVISISESADSARSVAKWRLSSAEHYCEACGSSGSRQFDAHSVVDGKAQFLLAAEVPFRRLDRDVSKQKLDLVQLATGKMAEPRAAAAEILWREFFDSGTLRGGSDDLPQYLGRHACSPDPTRFADRSKERAFGDATGFLPFIDRYLHP